MNSTKIILVVEVVEDDSSLKKALSEKLIHDGFTVLQAKNGKEGLDIALTNHPDLILLDLKMPVMDGMEMLKLLRADQWGKEAPVIILTNLGESENVAEAMSNNTFDFFIKSDTRLDEVIVKIKEKLAEKLHPKPVEKPAQKTMPPVKNGKPKAPAKKPKAPAKKKLPSKKK